MKQYVKLFEDFDPEEFLEDFGVDIFSPKSLINAINRREWNYPEIKEILLSGFNAGTYTYKESDYFIQEPGQIIVKANSRYTLSEVEGFQNIELNEFIKKFPEFAYLNINWRCVFTEKLHPDQKIIEVNCMFEAKSPKLANFNRTVADFCETAVEKDWRIALDETTASLDTLNDFEMSIGFDWPEEKRIGLNRQFAKYCKEYYIKFAKY